MLLGWLAAWASSTGCAGLPVLFPPSGQPDVYVAPFVDQTPGMRAGMTMTTTVQDHLYQRAPHRFLVVFDDAAVAVDGTVVSIDEVDAPTFLGGAKRDVIVRARVTLVDKRGRVRHETGIVERRARYEVTADSKETERRRDVALMIATSTVGRALADAILRVS